MRVLSSALLLLALAACTPAAPDAPPPVTPPPAIEAPAIEAPVAAAVTVPALSPADYQMRDLGDLALTGTEDVNAIASLVTERFGLKEIPEGNYTEETEVRAEGANSTVIFTKSGLADDAVKAEQHVVEIFLPAATASGVTGYGVRFQCYRAADPDAWTATPCV